MTSPNNLLAGERFPGIALPPPRAKMDTAALTLDPRLLEALRHVAPKKRRPTFAYVFGIALVTFLGVLVADASTRGYVADVAEQVLPR